MGLIYGFNELLKLFISENNIQFISYFVLIPISWNYIVLNSIFHAYDIPAISLYCWGVVLFMKNKFILFYIFFILSTLNRESSCFVTISIVILNLELNIKNSKRFILESFRNNKILIKHVLFQFLVWISIIFSVKYLVKNNPGAFYEETFSMINFVQCMIKNEACWPYLDVNSFFANPRCFLTLFLGLWFMIPLLWNYIPRSTKKLLLLIPIYLIPSILYANLMETRVYHELNIVISASVIIGIYNFFKKRNKSYN